MFTEIKFFQSSQVSLIGIGVFREIEVVFRVVTHLFSNVHIKATYQLQQNNPEAIDITLFC
jgi:hypothetical protein